MSRDPDMQERAESFYRTIDPGNNDAIDRAGELARLLVAEGSDPDPFWVEAMRRLAKGIVLYVLTDDAIRDRSWDQVRHLIWLGYAEGSAALELMGRSPLPGPYALLFEAMSHNHALGGVVAGIGDSFAEMSLDEQRTAIVVAAKLRALV